MEPLIEFWKLASRLKDEPRRGWAQQLTLRKTESVADHSFGVSILSLFEADLRGYDVARVVRLALIHDLEEAIIGDLTPADKRRLARKTVLERKKSAERQILGIMPPAQRRLYRKALSELEAGVTRQARLVKDLDKFEMALQARSYESKGANRGKIEDFYKSASAEIEDKALKKMLRGITGRVT